jgi:hypothetical protein
MIAYDIIYNSSIAYMKEKKLFDMPTNVSPRDREGVWGVLSKMCTGEYSFKEAIYIKYLWEKAKKSKLSNNVRNYLIQEYKRSKLDDELSEFRIEIAQSTLTEIYGTESNFIDLSFNSSLWCDLLKHYVTVSGKRKRFKVNFDNILTSKLQEAGVNCWLKSKWNWLSHQGKKWNGVYGCLLEDCDIEYKCHLDSIGVDGNAKIIVNWKDSDNFHEKITKIKRFEGERNKLAGNLKILNLFKIINELFLSIYKKAK